MFLMCFIIPCTVSTCTMCNEVTGACAHYISIEEESVDDNHHDIIIM